MILLLIFALVCVGAEDLVEEPKENCNCSRLLQEEETITDQPPTFPTTSFTCWDRYDGYYADVEVDCTIFHYCQTWHFPTGLNETVKWDFACPQSTIFNQKILSCTPPNISFDCQESPNYYWVNWINLTESTTFAPTEASDYSTPDYNIGQQLIVGGLKPHEELVFNSQESTSGHDDNELGAGQHSPEEVQGEAAISFPQQVSNTDQPESGSDASSEKEQPQEVISNSVNQEFLPEDTNFEESTETLQPQGVNSHSLSDEQVGDSEQQPSSQELPEGLSNENKTEVIHFPV